MINLFKLHDKVEDRGAYSWIVVNGPGVFDTFKFLVNKIIEKPDYSSKALSEEVSKRIGCSSSMLGDILYGRTKWISLVLMRELLDIFREINPSISITKLKGSFLDSIKFLKSAPRSTFKLKAVKGLSKELAEFCGIHAADGSLNLGISVESKDKKKVARLKSKLGKRFPELRISRVGPSRGKWQVSFYVTHKTRNEILDYLNRYNINYSVAYKLEFIDSSKSSIEYLKKIIFNLFGYQIKIKPKPGEGGGYYILFSNKIMGRYLKNIFDFPLGKKSDVVDAPGLIKKAPFAIQKAFIRGLIQFDGSVKRKGTIAFSTNSEKLLNFFLNILKKDRIRGTVWVRKRRKKELGFESSPTKQWLSYFIEGTLKYQRLYEYIYGFKEMVGSEKKAIKIFDKAFPPSSRSTLAFAELIKKASKLGEFTNYQILNKLNVNYRTLLFMLRILEKARIIKVNRVKMLERIEGKRDKITFNSEIKEWRVPYVYK